MYRSSIFSFEHFAGFQPRFPATLLAVAAAIAVLELGVRLIPDERLIPARSRQGEIGFMEREVLPRFPAPQVVLLGSSRVRRAVVPRLLDEQLNLPPNSTLNVGLASGRVYEALYLYERNRAQFKAARLVILNVDEWHLSSGWRLGSLYETRAPWAERLRMGERLRNRFILDGIFSMRLRLRMVPAALSSWFRPRRADVLDLRLDENNQVLPPTREGRPSDAEPSRFHEKVEAFYDHFEVSPVLAGHVEQLARLVREDGGTFVIMQLPNRSAYQAEVQKTHSKEYAAHIVALRALAQRLNTPLYILDQPAGCGLTDASYEDYGHMNPEGARVFTAWLSDLITRAGWLGSPPTK